MIAQRDSQRSSNGKVSHSIVPLVLLRVLPLLLLLPPLLLILVLNQHLQRGGACRRRRHRSRARGHRPFRRHTNVLQA